MLDQTNEPQLARSSRRRQDTANDQVQWHAHMNFAALATATEQVPPPLQTYTQATGELQLQARQRITYLSTVCPLVYGKCMQRPLRPRTLTRPLVTNLLVNKT